MSPDAFDFVKFNNELEIPCIIPLPFKQESSIRDGEFATLSPINRYEICPTLFDNGFICFQFKLDMFIWITGHPLHYQRPGNTHKQTSSN